MKIMIFNFYYVHAALWLGYKSTREIVILRLKHFKEKIFKFSDFLEIYVIFII